jgi:hypothetical protein
MQPHRDTRYAVICRFMAGLAGGLCLLFGIVSARLECAGRPSLPEAKVDFVCVCGVPDAFCITPTNGSLRGTVVHRETNMSTVTVGGSASRFWMVALAVSWLSSNWCPSLRSSEPLPSSHSSPLDFIASHSSSIPRLADMVGPCCHNTRFNPLDTTSVCT